MGEPLQIQADPSWLKLAGGKEGWVLKEHVAGKQITNDTAAREVPPAPHIGTHLPDPASPTLPFNRPVPSVGPLTIVLGVRSLQVRSKSAMGLSSGADGLGMTLHQLRKSKKYRRSKSRLDENKDPYGYSGTLRETGETGFSQTGYTLGSTQWSEFSAVSEVFRTQPIGCHRARFSVASLTWSLW